GVSTNWQQILSNSAVNLGNITYILMSSLGTTLGNALNLSPDADEEDGDDDAADDDNSIDPELAREKFAELRAQYVVTRDTIKAK
ncbi:hypothetical protein MJL48_34270, partial [Salmonella enterica subsp. enterica serovar Kentucky]|nr:hypothetical protein [Salmonella enterica subsp. enterica serovar Kentucky]